jgi:hypothetical protein
MNSSGAEKGVSESQFTITLRGKVVYVKLCIKQVMPQFEILMNTPTAFANFSPAVGVPATTLKGFALRQTLSRLERLFVWFPGFSLRSKSGLK